VAEGAAQYANLVCQNLSSQVKNIGDCGEENLDVVFSDTGFTAKAGDIFTPSQLLQLAQVIKKGNKIPVRIEIETKTEVTGWWDERVSTGGYIEHEQIRIDVDVFLLFEDGTRRYLGGAAEEIMDEPLSGELIGRMLKRIKLKLR
jgi:hypothetical protein